MVPLLAIADISTEDIINLLFLDEGIKLLCRHTLTSMLLSPLARRLHFYQLNLGRTPNQLIMHIHILILFQVITHFQWKKISLGSKSNIP